MKNRFIKDYFPKPKGDGIDFSKSTYRRRHFHPESKRNLINDTDGPRSSSVASDIVHNEQTISSTDGELRQNLPYRSDDVIFEKNRGSRDLQKPVRFTSKVHPGKDYKPGFYDTEEEYYAVRSAPSYNPPEHATRKSRFHIRGWNETDDNLKKLDISPPKDLNDLYEKLPNLRKHEHVIVKEELDPMAFYKSDGSVEKNVWKPSYIAQYDGDTSKIMNFYHPYSDIDASAPRPDNILELEPNSASSSNKYHRMTNQNYKQLYEKLDISPSETDQNFHRTLDTNEDSMRYADQYGNVNALTEATPISDDSSQIPQATYLENHGDFHHLPIVTALSQPTGNVVDNPEDDSFRRVDFLNSSDQNITTQLGSARNEINNTIDDTMNTMADMGYNMFDDINLI